MSTSTSDGRHALVIGASGLIGWSIVNQILSSYPSAGTFAKVTALVNRPLKLDDAFWPPQTIGQPKLELVSGVNLTAQDTEFQKLLIEKVQDVSSITHVYYCGKFPSSQSQPLS
jgi:uncharacterized protein YbjT (DUF2867 family)